jgi:hypothetical protein
MGLFLKFVFYSLLLSWLLNQFLRPFLDGFRSTEKPPEPGRKTKEPEDKVQIEYRKYKPEEGEYVDFEEIK